MVVLTIIFIYNINTCTYIHNITHDRILFWFNYLNGMSGSEYTELYDNGQIHLKYNYVDGMIGGKYTEWYDNGQIYLKYNYVNGKA